MMPPGTIRSVVLLLAGLLLLARCTTGLGSTSESAHVSSRVSSGRRERVSLNRGWRFMWTERNPDNLAYDRRPDNDGQGDLIMLKDWIVPSGNEFVSQPHRRPSGEYPWRDVPYLQKGFDDGAWEAVNLPHDWAIRGPFYVGNSTAVTGGMGRLPSQGVGWYRRTLSASAADLASSVYLEVDGAMSYAMVWLNEHLVGGWPYGYNSFQLDLSPYMTEGNNRLAIRLDNPLESSRWYPGGGLYRDVWLTKTARVHVAQWGTSITTRNVSAESATVDVAVRIANKANTSQVVEVATDIFEVDMATGEIGGKVAEFLRQLVEVTPGVLHVPNASVTILQPKLWGPVPEQTPHMYAAITEIRAAAANRTALDRYETRFGIRSIAYTPTGLLVNNQRVHLHGVNQHHDLGALGAAFHPAAATRQLRTLQQLGCNAIRTSHNPPAPGLLALADWLGILVLGEIFDVWERAKTAADFHLIFADWAEADLRAFLRRDRNHPSVVLWSVGNEVGEQYTNASGAALAARLVAIAHEEDPTRPVTAAMNYAKPEMDFPRPLDVLSLNYQGEGIRDGPAYGGLGGITTMPLYQKFHEAYPERMLLGSETAAALSSRGTYLFPVTNWTSAPVADGVVGGGGDPERRRVSAYELYTAAFGSSADKVFAAQDAAGDVVAGDFVWTGWDYLGEPTPYDASRSSYFGMIDLAGFWKDRAYLYQARWRPNLPMAHILPHWTWPDRVGQVVPVHVFTAADEAELFLNGKSLGRQQKGRSAYRFRWDHVTYQPGELCVVAYKNGTEWARDTVRTSASPAVLRLALDRETIKADGEDLAFATVDVLDDQGVLVPDAALPLVFSVSGPGEIVATDNGDPADMTPFPSSKRTTFSGRALAIVRAEIGAEGNITITAAVEGGSLAVSTARKRVKCAS